MENNVGYYVMALAAIIIGVVVIKKVASCLVRTVVTLVLIAALAAIYLLYLR